MKLTNLYTIVTILLVLNLPLAAKSETFGQDTIKCPFQTLHMSKATEYTVIYTERNLTILLQPVLLDTRTALVAFWDKQLADSKQMYSEAIVRKMKDTIARLDTLGSVIISSNAEFNKVVD